MTNDTSTLTMLDSELLLAVLKHHLTPELRRVVMATVPHAYNAWMGYNVMATARVSDMERDAAQRADWQAAAERWEAVASQA